MKKDMMFLKESWMKKECLKMVYNGIWTYVAMVAVNMRDSV